MICTHCNEPAMMRCRKHRHHLCGGTYCVDLHRWAGGDCEFVDPRRFEWMDGVIAVGIAAALITATAMAYVHLWRVQ